MKLIIFLSIICTTLQAMECKISNGKHTGRLEYLEIGDWSCDGHCLSQKFFICTNIATKDLENMYQKIVKKNPKADIANQVIDYEDRTISLETYKFLTDTLGIATEYFEETNEGEFSFGAKSWNAPQDFVSVYLKIIQHFYPNFLYSFVDFSGVNIGGYGLLTP